MKRILGFTILFAFADRKGPTESVSQLFFHPFGAGSFSYVTHGLRRGLFLPPQQGYGRCPRRHALSNRL
jgi:hypothetical protein